MTFEEVVKYLEAAAYIAIVLAVLGVPQMLSSYFDIRDRRGAREETERARRAEREETERVRQVEREEAERARLAERDETERARLAEREETERARRAEREETERARQVEREDAERARQVEREDAERARLAEREEAERARLAERAEAERRHTEMMTALFAIIDRTNNGRHDTPARGEDVNTEILRRLSVIESALGIGTEPDDDERVT